jgi:hypothetical protein
MLLKMIQTDLLPKNPRMPKRNKLIEQIFRSIFHMSKKTYFEFAENYRLLADSNIQVLEYLVSEAIANSPITALPLHSVTLQFCFSCIVQLQSTFNDDKMPFTQLIYTYIKTLVESERSMIYSTTPGFGYPTIFSKMLLQTENSKFEIRGGLLFKVLLVLFKCIEMLENPDILQFLAGLFTTNLQRLEHFKDILKMKSQKQQAVSDLFSSNKDYSDSN